MKIRKALAVVLSLAMTVTLMPATAFASSSNVASDVIAISEDEVIPATSLELTAKNTWTPDETTGKVTEVVTLTFGNAEWAVGKDNVDTTAGNTNKSVVSRATTLDGAQIAAGTKLITVGFDDDEVPQGGTAVAATITQIKQVKKSSVQLTIELSGEVKKDDVLTFDFSDVCFKANGDEGEDVTVTIEAETADITSGTYTIATISGGGTTATVSGSVKTFERGNVCKGSDIKIKETSVNSITKDSIHVLKLSLPKGYKWATGTTQKALEVTGTLFAEANVTDVQAQGDNQVSDLDTAGEAFTANDGRVLYVAVKGISSPSAKSTATLTPYFTITKDASEGDITVQVSDAKATTGSKVTTTSGLVIGIYGEGSVTVSTVDEDDIPTVVAGQYLDTDDELFYTAIVIDESVKETVTLKKDIDIEFPSNVQVVSQSIAESQNLDVTGGISYSTDEDAKLSDAPGTEIDDEDILWDDGKKVTEDTSAFSINLSKLLEDGDYDDIWDVDDTNTLTLYVPISVKANFTGDVVATVSGKDFETKKLTVAKAVAPLTITTTVSDVVNGAQDQAVANVTLKENVAGYIGDNVAKGKHILLKLDTKGLGTGFAFDNASVKVTEGDLEISDEVTYEGNYVELEVKNESTKASTIEITGMTISLSRYLPEGNYNLGVVAEANVDTAKNGVVENQKLNDSDFGKDDLFVTSAPYINITTAADTQQKGIVANFFLDGSKNSTYTVNGTEATMDAAAYLDSNNRTMVPIRYVAYALGLADTDISYNVGDSTATLSGLTNVVKVTTGSNILQASNGNVTMDTVAVNNSGRLYVPARFIAQAMGAQVAWDQATKTVTITK